MEKLNDAIMLKRSFHGYREHMIISHFAFRYKNTEDT
jgi:hypothetical protein